MTTDILETLPWIDYSEVFTKIEERGKAEGKAEGRAEGRAEGKAEGRAEERTTMIRTMMKTMSVADISTATGLSRMEIEALTKDM